MGNFLHINHQKIPGARNFDPLFTIYIWTHSGKKTHKCDQCDFKGACLQFSTPKTQKNPYWEKPFACDQCEHKCDDISQLRRHKRTHTGEKPLVCDQCEYRTNRKNSLNSHKKMHTGEKPYECEKCDYKCSVSTSFLKHKRVIHKVEKPFKCDLCEYKAKKLHGLTDHKRKRKWVFTY